MSNLKKAIELNDFKEGDDKHYISADEEAYFSDIFIRAMKSRIKEAQTDKELIFDPAQIEG